MLGLLFVFLTARPISLRRLGLFFLFVLVLSAGMLDVLGARHALSDALITASALTLFVWTFPLARMLRDSARARTLSLDGLQHVSAFVQWTYGIALAAFPVFAVGAFFISSHHLMFGMLTRLMLIAGTVGFIAPIGLSSLGRGGRPCRSSTGSVLPCDGRCPTQRHHRASGTFTRPSPPVREEHPRREGPSTEIFLYGTNPG